MPSELNILNPLEDSRWAEFIQRHPQASIFHSLEWAEALQRTYRYRPVVLTSAPSGEPLRDGLLCCEIDSWLTGSRLVSLPFSDHCQPLAEKGSSLRELLAGARLLAERQAYRFIELRPRVAPGIDELDGFTTTETHWLHTLSLDASSAVLFSRFHLSCIQRKIRKASKEGLSCEVGSGSRTLGDFYRLQVETRRRHGLPPQPRAWFQNLADCLGERLKIHLARHGDHPVAAVLTIRFKNTLVYKYGCSEARWHSTGVVPWLLWKTIEDGLASGCEEFDMGRTEVGNVGLTAFKDRWNAHRSSMSYFRCPQPPPGGRQGWLLEKSKPLWNRLPDRLLETAGGLLYRHFG